MRALTALILAMAGAAMAVAAPEPGLPTADGTEARPPLPAVKMQGAVAYLNGGAGLDESDYIKSRAAEFALQFIFSGRGGEYGVADRLTVRDGARELVSIANAGPFLMLQVPPGRYTVEASFKGAVESRTVVVGLGPTKVSWSTVRASD